jgi:hypothetical protein
LDACKSGTLFIGGIDHAMVCHHAVFHRSVCRFHGLKRRSKLLMGRNEVLIFDIYDYCCDFLPKNHVLSETYALIQIRNSATNDCLGKY